jgi:hypothetical protein
MGTDFYMFGYPAFEYNRKFSNTGSVDKICPEWRKS